MKKEFTFYILLILSIGFISAIPGIPHQFYGNVEVNGQPSDDILTALINSQNYSTIITDGIYGINPNTFFVEDPESSNNGDLITFYVGGKEAGTYIFENNKLTKLDFSLTTSCGDDYCLGDETCSSCSDDCGACITDNELIIFSPENKIYNTSKIDLKVHSNQDILIWMYSINSQTPEVFTPNITLTLYDGDYELTVIGINKAYQSILKTVSFSVDIPYEYCGDSSCNNGETCSTCSVDCGTCSSTKKRGSSDLYYKTNETDQVSSEKEPEISTNADSLTESTEETAGETEILNSDKENNGFFSGITGAVISFGENLGSTKIILIFAFFICVIIALLIITKVAKKRKEKISEY